MTFQQQMITNPGLHQHGAEGLGDVIHRSQSKPPGLILFFILDCEKNHGNVAGGRVFLKAGTDLVSIHMGHHDVQKNEIRQMLRHIFEGGYAIRGHAHLAVILQRAHKDVEVRLGVIHQQHGTLRQTLHKIYTPTFPAWPLMLLELPRPRRIYTLQENF